LPEPISDWFPYSSKPGLMGPKTRTITDSKSVLSLFSTDPPSRLGQIRRFTDLPQYHGTGFFLSTTYYRICFQIGTNPADRLGICQHHKAWAADFDENGNAFDIGFCFRRTIRNGLKVYLLRPGARKNRPRVLARSHEKRRFLTN